MGGQRTDRSRAFSDRQKARVYPTLATFRIVDQSLTNSRSNLHARSASSYATNKYLHNHSEKAQIMDPTFQLDTPENDDIDDKRDIIRDCLSEIVVEVGNRLREAGLNCPVFLTVPNSGDAIVMMATPLDPSDADWAHVGEIVRATVSERLNGLKLQNRDMICGAANAPIGAAEITAD
jgi:hypothetical protein